MFSMVLLTTVEIIDTEVFSLILHLLKPDNPDRTSALFVTPATLRTLISTLSHTLSHTFRHHPRASQSFSLHSCLEIYTAYNASAHYGIRQAMMARSAINAAYAGSSGLSG